MLWTLQRALEGKGLEEGIEDRQRYCKAMSRYRVLSAPFVQQMDLLRRSAFIQRADHVAVLLEAVSPNLLGCLVHEISYPCRSLMLLLV